MTQGAKLTSTDAVPEMSAAIERFRAEAMAALEELDMEIRRAIEWIQHDRFDHWNREIHRGWDSISEKRIALQQAMTFRRIGNDDPSCIDEKKALERARRRLEVAQQKLEITRHWARAIEKAVHEFVGTRTSLANWIDCEAPRAVSALHRIADQIETYLNIQPDATLELMNLAQTSEHNLFRQDSASSTGVSPVNVASEGQDARATVVGQAVPDNTRCQAEPDLRPCHKQHGQDAHATNDGAAP